MNDERAGIPWYFAVEDGAFLPSGLTRNPWFENAIAGGPVAALAGHVIDTAGFAENLDICRLTIDILGIVPRQPLTPRITAVRQGRQVQLHRVELMANGASVCQAHVLLARHADTPPHQPEMPWPLPGEFAEAPFLVGADMAGAIRTRPILGGVREPGRGVVWMRMDGEVVQGQSPSPFVKACLFADFGNGVGSATNAEDWSYANLDICMHFFRKPQGEWFLLDAHTEGAGNGHAFAQNIFADCTGVYAHGRQTVFVGRQQRLRDYRRQRS